MKATRRYHGLFAILLFAGLFSNTGICAELTQVPAAIQISSTVTSGKYTPEEIVSIAKKNGLGAVFLTDRDSMRWEYGLWPLRNIIKRSVEEKSLFKYGVGRYLDRIQKIQKENKGIMLIAGVESAPFYYWDGFPFGKGDFTLNNWHKHLLVLGLGAPADYARLPVTGNLKALILPFRWTNIFSSLLPALILLAGIFFLRRKNTSYYFNYHLDAYVERPDAFRRTLRAAGVALVIVGLATTWNNWPFRDLKFDQYHKDAGIMPYQNFIDYAVRRGGLVFWAHPEAKNYDRIGKVSIATDTYAQDLLRTSGYTGFTVFYDGYELIGRPGGVWDELLRQYCRGLRKDPVWAIGGLGFESAGSLDAALNDLRTIILVDTPGPAAAIDALRQGRMYIAKGSDCAQFVLDKFSVRQALTGGIPQITLSGHFLHGQPRQLTVKLIRDGMVIQSFDTAAPFAINYRDEGFPNKAKGYYRVEIQSDTLTVITNPLFVKKTDGL